MEPYRSSKVARLDSERRDFGPSRVLAPVVSNSIPSSPRKKTLPPTYPIPKDRLDPARAVAISSVLAVSRERFR